MLEEWSKGHQPPSKGRQPPPGWLKDANCEESVASRQDYPEEPSNESYIHTEQQKSTFYPRPVTNRINIAPMTMAGGGVKEVIHARKCRCRFSGSLGPAKGC